MNRQSTRAEIDIDISQGQIYFSVLFQAHPLAKASKVPTKNHDMPPLILKESI